MEQLQGRTALITGAAQRIGRAVATVLAREGVNVVIHYRTSTEQAEATASELRGVGVNAWTLAADLADPNEAANLLRRAEEEAGPVDLVVNNASIFPESTLTTLSPDDVHANVAVNALSPFVIARSLHDTGRAGAVVNLLDCMVADYDSKHVAYHLSKRMLYSFTRMMAVEFAPRVRVNGVAPGPTLPPAGKDESYLAGLASSNPLNRYGTPEDVAAAILFLLKSTFITGQVIFVDGGRSLRGAMYG